MMRGLRPDFLGIGVTKAGTTWLWTQLIKHPDVWMTPAKELHYFDRSVSYPTVNILATTHLRDRLAGSENWDRSQIVLGLGRILYSVLRVKPRNALWWSRWTFGNYDDSWYVSLFDDAEASQVCGEITPGYAILKIEDILRIRNINPGVRLILMIRDPIERAWSGLRHNVARGKAINWASERDVLARLGKEDVALRGDYERIVDNYLAVFDSSQLLVCFYDAISSDPGGLLAAITDFLDISPLRLGERELMKRVNVSPERPIPDSVKRILVAQYTPFIGRAARRFGSYAAQWELRYSSQSENEFWRASKHCSPAVRPISG